MNQTTTSNANAMNGEAADPAPVSIHGQRPGVTRISVNAQATPELAAVATNPAQPKVGPTTPDIKPALVAKAAS